MDTINTGYLDYTITTDKSLMDVHKVHRWLADNSYWSPGIVFGKVRMAFDNSFCIAALYEESLVGFGRLITDYTTFAYLADVFVLEEHRGKGVCKAMMKELFDMEWVIGLRGVMLATRDAHELYRQFGFAELPDPQRFMKLNR